MTSSADDSPSLDRGWDLVCPICYWRVPYRFVADQAQRLALHLVDVHPFEAALFVLFLDLERARAFAHG